MTLDVAAKFVQMRILYEKFEKSTIRHIVLTTTTIYNDSIIKFPFRFIVRPYIIRLKDVYDPIFFYISSIDGTKLSQICIIKVPVWVR